MKEPPIYSGDLVATLWEITLLGAARNLGSYTVGKRGPSTPLANTKATYTSLRFIGHEIKFDLGICVRELMVLIAVRCEIIRA